MTDVIVKRKKTSRDVEGTLSKAEMSEIMNQTGRLLDDYNGNPSAGEAYGTPVRGPEIVREIKKRHDILNERAPKTLTAKEKDDFAKRVKELEAIITKEMPTRNEMWKRPGEDGLDSDKAVRKNIHWEETTREQVQEWKNIKRTLEPQDPSASNIEVLRSR